jgi:hypothetical protein
MITTERRGEQKERRCRYCGIEGDRHTLRYERSSWGRALYDCRDVAACGARLRKGEQR